MSSHLTDKLHNQPLDEDKEQLHRNIIELDHILRLIHRYEKLLNLKKDPNK
jgi:hypothetical protein